MAESSRGSAKSGAGWIKKSGIALVVLFVLLLGAYLVGTSSAFLKGFVLPRVGAAVHGTVTADEISLSPFSSIRIRGLKVVTLGETPLLTVTELYARYSLLDILGGKITVEELVVDSPVVQIVPTPDGKDNLQPVLGDGTTAPPTPATAKSPNLNIHAVTLRNGSLRRVAALAAPNSGQQVLELHKLAMSHDQFAAGQSGKLSFSAEPRLLEGATNQLQSKLQLALELALNAASQPQSIKGTGRTDVTTATGSFAKLAGVSPVLAVDVSPTEVKQLLLRFEQGGKPIPGTLTIAGPFDMAKLEGRLKLEMAGIDRQLLDAVGAGAGLEFGAIQIGLTSAIEISQGAKSVRVAGALTTGDFSLVMQGKTLPPLRLNAAYDVQADLAAQSATISALNLTALQSGAPLVSGSLTAPMALSWGTATAGAGDAAFQLNVTNLNLPDWRAFTGETLTSGRVGALARVLARKGGRSLQLEADVAVGGLELKLGTRPFTQGALRLNVHGEVTDFKQLAFDVLKLDLTQAGQPALMVTGSASLDSALGAFSTKTAVSVVAERLMGSGPKQSLTVNLASEGTLVGKILQLQRMTVTLPSTPRAANNEISLTGRVDQTDPLAQTGALSVQSTALDLTSLYDVLTAGKSTAAPAGQTNAPPAVAGSGFPRVEPAPMVLPFKPLTLDVKLARVFLGELAITNLQAGLSINGGKIRVSPLEFGLNGTPVKAGVDLDLAGPAPAYALNWQVAGIALEPLINTFSPTLKGQAAGRVFSTAQIQGIGITGTNLQKTLAATFTASVTNANIQVVSGSKKVLYLPLDLNALATLLNIPELTRSPITGIELQATAGAGRIELANAMVKGDAFLASAAGGIRITELLENSPIQVPLEISLSRAIAQRANLLSSSTPTNAPYSKLPAFATVAGTLGKVETKIDKLQLFQITTRAASGLGLLGGKAAAAVGGAGDTVNNLTGAIGNLLGGQKAPSTNAPAAGASTNKPAPFNPLDLFKKKP